MSRAKKPWRRCGCGRSGWAADTDVLLAAETNVEDILATLAEASGRISSSSIRSRRCGATLAESAPGTVTQVRAGVQAMIRFAKQTGAAMVLVGHVTKDGQIAGPRVVEHMVDAVLYFEGEGGHHYRILRTVKNRFGPTDEIGVFEMSDKGLREVANPSELFPRRAQREIAGHRGLCRHGGDAADPGRSAGAGGADLARHPAPRRRRLGFRAAVDDPGGAGGPLRRQARTARRLPQHRRRLPHFRACGRSCCRLALVSSLAGIALPADCVYFGEVSLSGAVRPVAHTNQRLKEAEKLGFSAALLPSGSAELPKGTGGRWSEIESLPDLVARIAGLEGRFATCGRRGLILSSPAIGDDIGCTQ
jgi:DNA repair protein RadA/Sms